MFENMCAMPTDRQRFVWVEPAGMTRRDVAFAWHEHVRARHAFCLMIDSGQKGQKKKRSAELVEAEHPGQEHATRAQKHAKIREYGAAWLHHWERDTFKDWMHKQISEDLWWNEGLDCPYLQVRYVLKGKFSVP